MSGYAFAVGVSVALIVTLLTLLRMRRVREKYAVMWLALAGGIALLAAFPEVAVALAGLLGVHTPSNLVLSASVVVLLAFCIHLSIEASNLEEEVRTLAEEHGLLALRVSDLERRTSGADGGRP